MTTNPNSDTPPVRSELPPDEGARPYEHFIPIRKADLVRLLAEDEGLSEPQRGEFLELCKLVDSTIHYHYHSQLEELKNAYAPLDPDMDEQPRYGLAAEEVEERVEEVFAKSALLLERANFHKLGEDQIHGALNSASDWGLNLKLDFSIFERLEVYARGDVIGRRTVWRWRNFYRAQTIDVPTYQRLAVVFRLKEAAGGRKHPHPGPLPKGEGVKNHPSPLPKGEAEKQSPLAKRPVAMKLFKNIPKADLEMLLPGTRVRMTLLDQGRIWLPTVSGVGLTLFKIIVKGAALLALASISEMVAFLTLVAGTIGYGLNAFFGYLRTKDKYQLSLTRSLYFQNLDNNAGVFFRLLDEAEEQEFREAILAYWLLWRGGGDGGWTAPQIDRAAEKLLRERCQLHVDFEIDDALDKLRRMKLIEALPGGKWRAIPMQAALRQLDQAWDNFFLHNRAAKPAPMKQVLSRLQAA